ncbi:uncharacterized protein VTP21DRAFT_2310 [Calcarisporiella thermophila]|uniref:uncharacterized protein n=1 Tax=Calcarisporiella thermophila TaxID=911321 RepID=UPI0037449EBB
MCGKEPSNKTEGPRLKESFSRASKPVQIAPAPSAGAAAAPPFATSSLSPGPAAPSSPRRGGLLHRRAALGRRWPWARNKRARAGPSGTCTPQISFQSLTGRTRPSSSQCFAKTNRRLSFSFCVFTHSLLLLSRESPWSLALPPARPPRHHRWEQSLASVTIGKPPLIPSPHFPPSPPLWLPAPKSTQTKLQGPSGPLLQHRTLHEVRDLSATDHNHPNPPANPLPPPPLPHRSTTPPPQIIVIYC